MNITEVFRNFLLFLLLRFRRFSRSVHLLFLSCWFSDALFRTFVRSFVINLFSWRIDTMLYFIYLLGQLARSALFKKIWEKIVNFYNTLLQRQYKVLCNVIWYHFWLFSENLKESSRFKKFAKKKEGIFYKKKSEFLPKPHFISVHI